MIRLKLYVDNIKYKLKYFICMIIGIFSKKQRKYRKVINSFLCFLSICGYLFMRLVIIVLNIVNWVFRFNVSNMKKNIMVQNGEIGI